MSDRTDVQSLTQSIPAAAAAAGRHCATVVFYRNGPRRQLQEGLAVSVRCTPRGGKTGVPSPAEVLLPAVCQQARQQPLSNSKCNILNLTFQPCPCGGLPEVAVPYSDMWQDCRITFPHTSHATPSRAVGRSTPRPYMETSTRSTTYQMDRPTPPR